MTEKRRGQARHQRAYRARKKQQMQTLQAALKQCNAERDEFARYAQDLEQQLREAQPEERRPLLCSVLDSQAEELWNLMPSDLKEAYIVKCLRRQPPETIGARLEGP
ncbi:MAG: hypothetical protein EOO77_19020 [Oxalobacteraceae bacterium]|nr:MAG: hypothetical protein EOO77_19020 [Oxalobacteraceae bacterium]